jgi:hypothetical protein
MKWIWKKWKILKPYKQKIIMNNNIIKNLNNGEINSLQPWGKIKEKNQEIILK